MQAQINTSGGRVGLARSRASLNDDQNGSQQKKHKNWVHDEVHEANGQQQCKHCNTKVSASNVSYRKRHLLGCEAFLGSQAAREAAANNQDVKEAVDAHNKYDLAVGG